MTSSSERPTITPRPQPPTCDHGWPTDRPGRSKDCYHCKHDDIIDTHQRV